MPEKNKFPLLLTLCALSVFAVLIALGNWQKARLTWKEQIISKIEMRVDADARPLSAIEVLHQNKADIEYVPTTLSGQFLHDKEQHYFATYKGASGYFIYTPLKLTGRNAHIFVNRGFVPFSSKPQETRLEGQVEGQVSLKGLARSALFEKPSVVIPNHDLGKNIFYWKDISNMTAQAGFKMSGTVIRFFIDLDETPNPGGLPIGGVTRIDLPNNHLQYMVTWYGLALTLLGVWAAYLVQWRKKQRTDKTGETDDA